MRVCVRERERERGEEKTLSLSCFLEWNDFVGGGFGDFFGDWWFRLLYL